jgi:hypothetical protein
LKLGNDSRQASRAERTAANMWNLSDNCRAEAICDLLGSFGHDLLSPFLPPGTSLGRRFKRKCDLHVVPVDDQSDGALACALAHAVEEFPQSVCLSLNGLFCRVALNNDRFVKEKPTSLGIIAPNSLALRKRRGAAKELAQNGQGLADPVFLVDWLVVPVLARYEENQQGGGSLAGT